MWGDLARISSGDLDAAGGRLHEAMDQLQRRGLSAPRATDEREHLTAKDAQRQAVDRQALAVPLAHLVDDDHGRF